jgi:hypothetical protein
MNELLPTTFQPTNALELYTERNVDQVLAAVRTEATSVVFDVTTKKGRDDIASMAYKVSRSKTHLDDMGKELVADWKKKSAAVDAMRKKLRDGLDAIRDEVRAPLNEWETKEATRKSERLAELDAIKALYAVSVADLPQYTLDQLQDRSAKLRASRSNSADWWMEFAPEAERMLNEGADKIDLLIVAKKQQLAETVELERKRVEAEKAAQEAERQRIEAEAKAKAEKAAQAAIDAANRAAEQAKLDAELAAKRADEQAKRAEQQAKLMAEQAKLSEQRAAAQAIADEQRRVELQRQQEAAAQAKREADKRNRLKVASELTDDIFAVIDAAVMADADVTRALVEALMTGKIRRVTVNF